MAFVDDTTVDRTKIQTNRVPCRITTRTMPAWPRNSDVINSQECQSQNGNTSNNSISSHVSGVVHQLHMHIAQPCSPCCMTLSSADSPVRKQGNLGTVSEPPTPEQCQHPYLAQRPLPTLPRPAPVPGALVPPLADRRECTLRDALLPVCAVPCLKQLCVPQAAALCGEYGVLRAEMI